MTVWRLQGGRIHDPANGLDGVVQDLWIRDGQIIAPPEIEQQPGHRTIDCTGLVLMPGGIDMHCHIAGPKVNTARKMLPEERRLAEVYPSKPGQRSGTGSMVPSTFATGALYAGMGYTTAFDAAIPPLLARHAHDEFTDTPILDKGCYILMGNNRYALDCLQQHDPERLTAYMAWLLKAAQGFSVKIVNPGGVEAWKQNRDNLHSVDEQVPGFGVTAREVIQGLAATANRLGLPHPVHIHCNNLGFPGNWQTTLASFRARDGYRAHFTHIQFHSYAGDANDQATFGSAVPQLADYINQHPDVTVDVGQVWFGQTVSMTGDGPLGYYLHRVTGRKWFNGDVENEAGCGIVPIEYRDKSLVHALQWAIGLEWFLLVQNPWQIALSTDHPNGAAFLTYPRIIAALMDRQLRRDLLATLPAGLRERCTLADLNREYTLNEIAIVTRAAPARMLGLTHKGHLGPGADADIAAYQPGADLQRMFELPYYVWKAGELVIDRGERRSSPQGTTLVCRPEGPADRLDGLAAWFAENSSVQLANYPIADEELPFRRNVPTVPKAD